MPGLWVRASPGAATLFFYSIPACWPKKRISWQLWDSNPRPFGLVPKTSALDHSAKLPLWSKHCLQENQARSLLCPESNPPVLFIKLEDWCSKSGFASCEVWTHDPWFTRPVLYHWAKEALLTRCQISNFFKYATLHVKNRLFIIWFSLAAWRYNRQW